MPSIEVLRAFSECFDIELSALIFFAEQDDLMSIKGRAKSLLKKTTINFLEYLQK